MQVFISGIFVRFVLRAPCFGADALVAGKPVAEVFAVVAAHGGDGFDAEIGAFAQEAAGGLQAQGVDVAGDALSGAAAELLFEVAFVDAAASRELGDGERGVVFAVDDVEGVFDGVVLAGAVVVFEELGEPGQAGGFEAQAFCGVCGRRAAA